MPKKHRNQIKIAYLGSFLAQKIAPPPTLGQFFFPNSPPPGQTFSQIPHPARGGMWGKELNRALDIFALIKVFFSIAIYCGTHKKGGCL